MAMINCPKCNKEVSDQEKRCPDCGAYLVETNSISTLCKFAAVLIFIAAFIGTIIVCTTETFAYYGNTTEFNWTTAWIAWGISFVLCLLLFASGEIINQLAISNSNAIKKRQQNEQIIHDLMGDQYEEETPSTFDVDEFVQ